MRSRRVATATAASLACVVLTAGAAAAAPPEHFEGADEPTTIAGLREQIGSGANMTNQESSDP